MEFFICALALYLFCWIKMFVVSPNCHPLLADNCLSIRYSCPVFNTTRRWIPVFHLPLLWLRLSAALKKRFHKTLAKQNFIQKINRSETLINSSIAPIDKKQCLINTSLIVHRWVVDVISKRASVARPPCPTRCPFEFDRQFLLSVCGRSGRRAENQWHRLAVVYRR